MDEKITEQVKDNLNEIKEYAGRFPENAGWRWVVESVDKTLMIIDPEEEKVDEGFDMPKKAEPKVPLPPPSGTDPETEPLAGTMTTSNEMDGTATTPIDPIIETEDIVEEE